MIQLIVWSEDEAKRKLYERLQMARKDRKLVEDQWRRNEEALFKQFTSSNLLSFGTNAQGAEELSLTINYLYKNAKFIHSQLATNPPEVIPKANTNETDDRRKADAANRAVQYMRKQYKLQNNIDLASLNTVTYGTGWIKTLWNPNIGELRDFNEETGECVLDGDMEVKVPSVWNVYPDPDAENWDQVQYVFEKFTMPYEQALYTWPEQEELLKSYRIPMGQTGIYEGGSERVEVLRPKKYDSIELYEYWEKGLPQNGFQGRYCICSKDGTPLTGIKANPESFAKPGKKFGKAQLPYHMFTDIDIPNKIWGKSFIDYSYDIQEMLNRLDTTAIRNARAHAVGRIMVHEDSKVSGDSITNEETDVIKYAGSIKPEYMMPMPMPQILPQLMQRYQTSIDDMAGMNESMFGKQTRETSGFSMQFAVNQGNLIRHRLFVKYTEFVEAVYRHLLNDIIKFWDIPRNIKLIGKEQAFEVVDLKGSDLDGGWDICLDYGTSFSLDPSTRKQEIISLMPFFEKSGVDFRQILSMLKMNELSSLYDTLDLPMRRQKEYFEEMIAKGLYLHPAPKEDHVNMLIWAYQYIMTAEFKYLSDADKVMIRNHMDERAQLQQKEAAELQSLTNMNTGAGGPGVTPIPGAAPSKPGGPSAPEASPTQPLDMAALNAQNPGGPTAGQPVGSAGSPGTPG